MPSRSLEEMVGRQLMIGAKGTSASASMIRLFKETHAGAFIVFRPNFLSARGFRRMISGLETALGRRLLVAVDHEGGRVIHLAEGITVFPDNLALGETGRMAYARRQGEIEARELRRLGIDLNLAPTVDVLTKTFSPNIGIRSYGRDPDLVARFGAARIKAMQAGGLSASAKHFPGQGHSPRDAHLGLPVLSGTWREMEKVHLKPFLAAMKAGVHTVMSSHPVYPNLDATRVPATFSTRIIKDYLRGKLGFDGVILSDDLEMGALKNICPIGEAACRAVEAGHDIVLVCHDPDAVRSVYQSLLEAYRNGRLPLRELQKSVERIEWLKSKRKTRFARGSLTPEKGGEKLAGEIAQKAINRHCEAPQGRSNLKTETAKGATRPRSDTSEGLTQRTVVIFPKLSSLRKRIFIENVFSNEKKFVQNELWKHGIKKATVRLVSFDASATDIKKAGRLAREYERTIFFCYDAHLYPGCRKLLVTLQKSARHLAVVLLRDPYDDVFVRKNIVCVKAYGFRAVQIRAALNAVCAWRS